MTPTSLLNFKNFPRHIAQLGTVALSLAVGFAIVATTAARAQTFKVIYTFTGGADGAGPQPGLTMDGAGNFYGATGSVGLSNGSACDTGCGTVFHLLNADSGWILIPLYHFQGPPDGLIPSGRVTIAQDGTLYGVTNQGGRGSCQFGCGTVYHVSPAASGLALWNETVIHYFTISDGDYPQGDVSFDREGNLYVTAAVGGSSGDGVVYQLTPSGGGWLGNVIYSFQGLDDGANPSGGVVIDRSGNLYGITEEGGFRGGGTLYQLSLSGSSWTERTIQAFAHTSGCVPVGGLIVDSAGNLYGTTTACGTHGAGTVFRLSPSGVLNVLYNLPSISGSGCIYSYFCGSLGKLAMDAAGNLYGTVTAGGAYGAGTVFKLTNGTNGWTYTSLHDFTGQSDPTGAYPTSTLIIDANGNLYGTASEGGTYNNGTVFEITP
ncbi:MAG: choice-of-anchor tandem repeat GloVer-containing protein [Candidatus Korobacteraceae bacterium]